MLSMSISQQFPYKHNRQCQWTNHNQQSPYKTATVNNAMLGVIVQESSFQLTYDQCRTPYENNNHQFVEFVEITIVDFNCCES